jgi:nucleotide-binding universal stress UspA family protein
MTAPLETILVATDFSDASEKAVARAASLARQHQLRLHLVHSTGEGDWLARLADNSHGVFSHEIWAKAAGAALARIRRGLEEQGHTGISTDVLTQPLYQCLGHLVQDNGIGLLVMGAQGERGFRAALLGSTADRVLRAGVVPVLLVRGDPAAAYGRVALATDFSPVSAQAAALGLALVPEASHYLLHANEIPLDRGLAFANLSRELLDDYRSQLQRESAERMKAFALSVGAAAMSAVRAPREGAPAQVLQAFVLEAGIDLVVLGARARARWEANLLGSTALFAVTGLACDVLLVPAPLN